MKEKIRFYNRKSSRLLLCKSQEYYWKDTKERIRTS